VVYKFSIGKLKLKQGEGTVVRHAADKKFTYQYVELEWQPGKWLLAVLKYDWENHIKGSCIVDWDWPHYGNDGYHNPQAFRLCVDKNFIYLFAIRRRVAVPSDFDIQSYKLYKVDKSTMTLVATTPMAEIEYHSQHFGAFSISFIADKNNLRLFYGYCGMSGYGCYPRLLDIGGTPPPVQFRFIHISVATFSKGLSLIDTWHSNDMSRIIYGGEEITLYSFENASSRNKSAGIDSSQNIYYGQSTHTLKLIYHPPPIGPSWDFQISEASSGTTLHPYPSSYVSDRLWSFYVIGETCNFLGQCGENIPHYEITDKSWNTIFSCNELPPGSSRIITAMTNMTGYFEGYYCE
jgi:hypothetical protein